MYDPPIEIPGSSEESEAEDIEMKAADRAVSCGLGVSEWECCLDTKDILRLIELADQGFGTWAREPETLERMKRYQRKKGNL